MGKQQVYWPFKWQTSTISHRKTWTRQRKGNFKRETESLLIAAQNNIIRTNHVQARILYNMILYANALSKRKKSKTRHNLVENEVLTSENENITLPNNAKPNNNKETLSQEQKINLENVQRIMNSEKTTLPSDLDTAKKGKL